MHCYVDERWVGGFVNTRQRSRFSIKYTGMNTHTHKKKEGTQANTLERKTKAKRKEGRAK
jgi:hypothetical protein